MERERHSTPLALAKTSESFSEWKEFRFSLHGCFLGETSGHGSKVS
jgi:hypothetical protein